MTARKSSCDRGHFDIRSSQLLFGKCDKVGIDTNGRHMGQIGNLIVQVQGFGTQLSDFARRIHTFQSRQVDHAQYHLQALRLGVALDTAVGETVGALDNTDLVDGWTIRRTDAWFHDGVNRCGCEGCEISGQSPVANRLRQAWDGAHSGILLANSILARIFVA